MVKIKKLAASFLSIALGILILKTEIVDGRKTYIIKEKIESGELKVERPRVRANDVEYCWFKTSENYYCYTADQMLKAEYKWNYEYQEMFDGTSPPNFKLTLDITATMSSFWKLVLSLKNIYYNSIDLTMPEFFITLTYEVIYWADQDAWCMNFITKLAPVSFKMSTNNKLGQCSKMLISCLDNWTLWSKIDAKWLETCRLGSGTEFKLWEYQPLAASPSEDTYYLGNKNYVPQYCWPGPSPFYSPIDKYPDNPILGFIDAYNEVYRFVEDHIKAVIPLTTPAKPAV